MTHRLPLHYRRTGKSAFLPGLLLAMTIACASSPATTPDARLNTRANFDPAGVPRLSSPVTDIHGVLGHDLEAELNHQLSKLRRERGFRVAVLVIPNTGKETAERYAQRIYDANDLGGAGPNDGLLLLVAIDSKDIYTAIGEHLQPVFGPRAALEISRGIMIPYFQKKQYDRGVYAGTRAIIARLRG